MQTVFFRNLLFLVTLNIIIKPLWILGIDRSVQNMVGASSYGIYFALFNLSILTQIILDVGISNYSNRYLAQNENELISHLSNIFSIKLLLSGIYIGITLLIAKIIRFNNYELCLLALICLNQVFASLIVYTRANISAMHHFRVDSMLSVLDKALMIIFCGFLLLTPPFKFQFKIEWFIYSQAAAYIITLVLALIYVIRLSGRIQFSFSIEFATTLFRRSFPFALLILSMAIYSRIDGVMITKISGADGAEEAGIYASAFRLLDALNQFGYLFAVLLLPIFSRMLARNQNIQNLVRTSFSVIYIFSLIICLALSCFAEPIMYLLYHEASPYSSRILSILVYSFLGTGTVYIFGTLLTANGNLKELILISLIAVVLNIILNAFLIPRYGALGAAYAASVTNLTIGFLNFLLSVKIFGFRFNTVLVARLGLFTVACVLLFVLLPSSNFNWFGLILLSGCLCLGIAFLLRLVELKQIMGVLRPEEK